MTSKHQKNTVVVGKRGTIVIPAHIRQELELEEGDMLEIVRHDSSIEFTKIDDDPIEHFRKVSAPYFKGVDPVKYQRQLRDDGP